DIAVVCGSFLTQNRLALILWESHSFDIYKPELPPRVGVTVCCRFCETCECLRGVLRHAFTISISQSHFVLSNGITPVGSVEYAIHIRALNCVLNCKNKLLPGGR